MAINYSYRTEVISGNNFVWVCADDEENRVYYEHAAVCANGVVDEVASEERLYSIILELRQEENPE